MNKLIAVIVVVLLVIIPFGIYRSTIDEVDVTITDKERVMNDGDSKYLVFTKDEVFENSDSIFFFKFNSSDFYNDLQIDEQYNIRVVGLRIPFLSQYRNIVDYEALD